MNEVTLNALINLFAIFSAITRTDRVFARSSFASYLELHLGISSSDEYLKLFDELAEFYAWDESEQPLVDPVKQAETICNNLRGRFHRTEHIMVFLRFLELAREDRENEKTRELFHTVARVFNISEADVARYQAFIYGGREHPGIDSQFLLINSDEKFTHPQARHIHRDLSGGEIVFLFLKEVSHYIFIFRGKDNLYLEGNPILPGRFYAFREGGIIRGSKIAPVYYTDVNAAFVDEDKTPVFSLTGCNIEFKFRNSNNGLHEFSFSEPSGQLIAIMGGSGVGKSTLLNILNGNIPLDKGEILINDVNISTHRDQIEGLIGFVPQDDLLFEELTVWENLLFNAKLCLAGLTEAEIDQAVTRVLQELELYEFRQLKVGSPLKKFISGGQRKRLNIALELIREPSILYVDEPTSGLSSMDSEKVMLLLKQQARKGQLVIVNIHQPSSDIFKMFDKLWIMDKGGRMIYTGNPLDAIIYFKDLTNHVNSLECECQMCGNVNPEQVLEIVETKKINESGEFTQERRFPPEEWYRLFRARNDKEGIQEPGSAKGVPVTHFKKPGIWNQLKIFFERNLRIKVSDKQYLFINLFEAPILAVIVGFFTRYAEGGEYIFSDNKNLISYIFMAIVVVLFMGMSVSAEEIIKDRKILQRESFLNLSRFSYINSKVLFLILLSAFQSLAFVIIGNLVIGIHGLTFAYWLVLFSVAVFSTLLGLNISAAFDSVVAIYILIPLLLIPQILLCGVIVKFDDLQSKTAEKDAVPVVGDIMVSRWAFEALAVEQFSGNRYMARFFDLEKEMSQAVLKADLLIPELLGKLDYTAGQIRLGRPVAELAPDLTIIRNEIKELDAREKPAPGFPLTDAIMPASFNDQVADAAMDHLKKIHEKYRESNRKLRSRKDNQVIEINHSNGPDYLYKQKKRYHNLAIEELVLNTKTKDFIRQTGTGLMQKIAPVYKDPDFRTGRAHFLASSKRVGPLSINTLGFNAGVIWLMSVILYLALYYNWLRKLLEGIPRRKSGKKH